MLPHNCCQGEGKLTYLWERSRLCYCEWHNRTEQFSVLFVLSLSRESEYHTLSQFGKYIKTNTQGRNKSLVKQYSALPCVFHSALFLSLFLRPLGHTSRHVHFIHSVSFACFYNLQALVSLYFILYMFFFLTYL